MYFAVDFLIFAVERAVGGFVPLEVLAISRAFFCILPSQCYPMRRTSDRGLWNLKRI